MLNTCEKPTIREDLVIQTDDIEVIKNEILKPETKQAISSVEYWDTNCQNLLGSNPEAKYFVLVQLASSSAAEIEKCLESLAEKELNISLLNSKQAEEASSACFELSNEMLSSFSAKLSKHFSISAALLEASCTNTKYFASGLLPNKF